jgi:hypothetical protein
MDIENKTGNILTGESAEMAARLITRAAQWLVGQSSIGMRVR